MKIRENNIKFRTASHEDAPGIRAAIRSSIEGLAAKDYPQEVIKSWGANTPVAEERQASAIKEGKEITWVALSNGNVIGFSAFNPISEELRAVYVAAEFARQGIGTKLLELVETEAFNLGLKKLKMHSSLTAVPFYLGHGYVKMSEVTHTLNTGVQMVAVAMEKQLMSGSCKRTKPELNLKRMLDASGIKVEIHQGDSWLTTIIQQVFKRGRN